MVYSGIHLLFLGLLDAEMQEIKRLETEPKSHVRAAHLHGTVGRFVKLVEARRSKDLLEAHVDEIRQQPTIAGFTIKVTPLEELADGRFHLQVVIQFGQLIQLLVVPSGQADGGVIAQTTAQFNVRRRYEVGQERPEVGARYAHLLPALDAGNDKRVVGLAGLRALGGFRRGGEGAVFGLLLSSRERAVVEAEATLADASVAGEAALGRTVGAVFAQVVLCLFVARVNEVDAVDHVRRGEGLVWFIISFFL